MRPDQNSGPQPTHCKPNPSPMRASMHSANGRMAEGGAGTAAAASIAASGVPVPAASASSSAGPVTRLRPSASSSSSPVPSSSSSSRRVVMHVDMDCFYAQVERERFPHWSGHPIAVVQNASLAVTSNYRIRARGWPKMGPPELMAPAPGARFAGSNMARYRAASKAWYALFRECAAAEGEGAVVVMKKSIDESYLDLTAACHARIRAGRVARVVRQSDEERLRIETAARARKTEAEAAWRAADAEMLAQGVAPADLESTGALRAAQLFSRSTDPITELRRRAQEQEQAARGAGGPDPPPDERDAPVGAAPNGTNPKAPNAAHLASLSAAEVDALCDALHPLDHCRADKRLPPVMLQPLSAPVAPEQRLPGVEAAPWRELYCGYVFLDGTDSAAPSGSGTRPGPGPAPSVSAPAPSTSVNADGVAVRLKFDPTVLASSASVSPPAAAAVAAAPAAATPGALHSSSPSPASSASPLAAIDEDVSIPPSSFSHEDPSDPSHDLLLAVGSQIAFEIRCRLFERLGYTTSAGVAPNCMLAKLASSTNKPNQQSVVRAGVAPAFLRPIKLAAISGFGPKAEAQAEERGLVTVGDVQRLSGAQLARLFPANDKFVSYLCDIGAGVDLTPVLVHAAPRSIGQSKRQRTRTAQERASLLDWLCLKLTERVVEDEKEYARRATVLTLSWITGGDWTSVSRRAPMPPLREHRTDGLPLHTDMLETASRLARTNLPPVIDLRCLAVSVSHFVPLQLGKGIEGYFTAGASAAAASQSGATTSQQSSAAAAAAAAASSTPSLVSFFSGSSSRFAVPAAPTSSRASARPFSPNMPALEAAPAPLASDLLDGVVQQSRVREAAAAARAAAEEVAEIELSQTERDEIEELFSGSQPATFVHPSSSTLVAGAAAPSSIMSACDECGQAVESSRMAEHADFHFAARFQAQLREQDRRERERLQQAAAAAAGGLARKKGANGLSAGSGSLDRYMVAQPPPSGPAAAAVASGAGVGASASAPSKPAAVHPLRTPTKRPASAAPSPTLKSFFSRAP